MFGIGMPELILILAIALIVLGPRKLPDVAKSLGKALGEFKKATRDFKETMEIEPELKEVKEAFKGFDKDVRETVSPPEPDPAKSDLSTPATPEAAREQAPPDEQKNQEEPKS